MERASVHILFAAALVLLPACDNEVAGPIGVDEPFAVYGIMNPRLEMQTLLVGPTATSLLDYDDTIDATVTSTDLTTGTEYTWQDSVVAGARGQSDHVFVARFRPDFGSRHRVVVRRSDGETSEVDVEVPGHVSFETEDDGTSDLGVRIRGDQFQVIFAEVTYGVRLYRPGMKPREMCETMPLSLYTLNLEAEGSAARDEWALAFDMTEQLYLIQSYYALENGVRFPTPTRLALMEMELKITVGSLNWDPPGGEFDRGALSSPNVLANVTNGLGFVSGGYHQEHSLWPSEEAVDDAGVYDFLMRPPGPCLNFCACGLGD